MIDYTSAYQPQPIRPVAAVVAAVRLMRDTEDTRQVALLQIALAGKSQRNVFKRFAASANGQRILAERRNLVPTLDDHDYLRTLPAHSLGRHYLAFMEAEGLSAQGLMDATPAVTAHLATLAEPYRIFSDYTQRGAHDLHHVLLGYGREELGETCVLAMAYQQLRLRGYQVIAAVGPYVVAKKLRRLGVATKGVFAATREAAAIGRAANWFVDLDIEAALAEDIDELRARLNIRKPMIYHEVLAQVRAQTGWRHGPFGALLT